MKSVRAKIANRRKDSPHKFSRVLVNRARKISVGSVLASALTKTRMAKSVLHAGWPVLRDLFRYKCVHAGLAYAEVNAANTRPGPARPVAAGAAPRNGLVSVLGDGGAARARRNTTAIRTPR